jgi:hypothetical protein
MTEEEKTHLLDNLFLADSDFRRALTGSFDLGKGNATGKIVH